MLSKRLVRNMCNSDWKGVETVGVETVRGGQKEIR